MTRFLLAALASLSLVAGCAANSGDADVADSNGAEQDLAASPTKAIADGKPLKDASFEALRSLYSATTYDGQATQNTTAFSFTASPSMSDADALALAKGIAKTAHYGAVHAWVLNAAGTPTKLSHLANSLAQNISATQDDANTPKLITAMVAAFGAHDGTVKVFTAIGPGDDHDWDNVDREAIFLDVKTGEALVLQGQQIDM